MGRITLKQVKKSFGDVTVIPPLDLEIEDGEFVVFVGPSGCGKSTLLRLIAGLEDTTSGTIDIDILVLITQHGPEHGAHQRDPKAIRIIVYGQQTDADLFAALFKASADDEAADGWHTLPDGTGVKVLYAEWVAGR